MITISRKMLTFTSGVMANELWYTEAFRASSVDIGAKMGSGSSVDLCIR